MDNSDNKKSDQELVESALRDSHAFAAIVDRYQAPLERYVRRLGCLDPHDREDVLQEVFLKIYVNLNEYDPDLKFSSWAYRITHNETITFFRKKNIRPSAVATEQELNLFNLIPDESDIADSYNRKLEADTLRKAMSVLESKYRDVLILRFMEDKNYTEISDILKIPVGTVGTFVNRGKKRLKKILENMN